MMFMMPHEREQIYRDVEAYLYGEDGMDVIIHYADKSGAVDTYGRSASETDREAAQIRAAVAPLSQRADRSKEVERKPVLDAQLYDVAILVSAEKVDISGYEGVWFEVPGIGNFVPDAKPPQDASPHFPIPLEARKFFREFICHLER